MTAWSPEWRIKINGSTLTNVTLADLAITNGRTSIYEQTTPSYANINLIILNEQSVNLDLNDPVTVEIKDSTSTFVPIFGGFISEVSKSINTTGSIGFTQVFRILALGALARLPRQLTDGVLVKDQDGDQIYSVLEGILINSWSEVAGALTWANYDPTVTWANAENVGLGEIDRPGNYELTARSSSTIDVYSLVSQLATSGFGYIYENGSGQICYADSTHRSIYLATNGYVDLDAQEAVAQGLTINTRGGDVRNYITITYKNGQQETDSDSDSIYQFGLLAQNITTSLELTADAQAQAARYLALRAYPQPILESVSFQLQNSLITSVDRDALLGVFMGMPVNLENLPSNMGLAYQGFVEGFQFSASYNGLTVTLFLSPVSYSLEAMKWEDVPGSETWSSLSPTMTWLEALIVS